MLSIHKTTGLMLLASMLAGATTTLAQGVYTTNPLVEWIVRQSFELRLDAMIDSQDNQHHRAGMLGGFGWGLTDSLSLGIYGSMRGSDRDQPARSSVIRGTGAYGEYSFYPSARIAPIAGLRLGILAPTGPRAPTSLHVAGSAGMRAALTDRLHLVLTGTVNWAEDPILNYRRTDTGYKVSDMDASIDLGLRYRF